MQKTTEKTTQKTTQAKKKKIITAEGNADSTENGRKNAVQNFNTYLVLVGKPILANMQRDDLNQQLMFDWATWMVNDFEYRPGQKLMMRTCSQYIGRVMAVAKAQFKGKSDDEFFSGLEENAPATHWYKKYLKNVERHAARRCIDEGEKITESPPPIGRAVVSAVALAYFLEGGQEALLRRLVIVLLFLVCGRCGEAATASWALCHWCPIYGNLYFDWSQSKTGKQKGLGLFGDFDRNEMDIYKAFGDLFITGYFTTVTADSWLFHTFQAMDPANVASKISNYLKDLRDSPKNKCKGYQQSRIATLPDEVSSGSLRVGAICEMDKAGIFPHRIAAYSGFIGLFSTP